MLNNQPIKFLLHQLETNERDLQNVQNSHLNGRLPFLIAKTDSGVMFEQDSRNHRYLSIEGSPDWLTELFIRICLSRVNGKAVLGVFEDVKIDSKEVKGEFFSPEWGISMLNVMQNNLTQKSLDLYLAFDQPLRNGNDLDTALHDKMLELVPEYVEFCKNNK